MGAGECTCADGCWSRIAGEVAAVGELVNGFEVGDRVSGEGRDHVWLL